MSEDWKAGDLALCIKMGPWVTFGKNAVSDGAGPRCGQHLTVREVQTFDGRKALSFDAWRRDCFLADRFVKITPLPRDEFDREVISLMKRKTAPKKKAGKMNDEIKNELDKIVSSITHHSVDGALALDPASTLDRDLKIDSIDRAALAIDLEDTFHISISDDEVQSWRSVSDVHYTVGRKARHEAAI